LRVIAVSGYKDSGKTTLCGVLIEELSSRGLSVGYIKRTREKVISPENTDSGSVATAGQPALLWGDDGLRLEVASGDDRSSNPYEIAGKFFPGSDIVILEGGKNLALPKIWVARKDEPTPEEPGIFAVYDRHLGGDGGLRYGEGDINRLVSDVLGKIDAAGKSARVYVGGMELPMKDFVSDFVAGGVKGMIGSLKKPDGMDETEDLRVYVKGLRREGTK
jgi:molybdopterin-guanine dinucleotide biosynthesis protein B